jgi:hypothetical protein
MTERSPYVFHSADRRRRRHHNNHHNQQQQQPVMEAEGIARTNKLDRG